MFRGKESSNRIELSRLVMGLLNFGVLGCMRLWGAGRYVVGDLGGWEVSPNVCTHMHMHAHTHKKLQMAANMFIMIVVSSLSSLSSPCHPHHPDVVPLILTSSLSSPHYLQTPI